MKIKLAFTEIKFIIASKIIAGGNMNFQIKSKIDGKILFELETSSFKLCIEAAVKSCADLSRADLSCADLSYADLSRADLSRANLSRADLSRADLSYADLSRADLSRADLYCANLSRANLSRAKNMVKTMGVEIGNYYWKRFNDDLINNKYQFKVGINKLRDGEKFADDERVTCDYPAFHFASRSWCAVNYPERPLEARIRIPEGAKINEPWATDGKASADMIEIIQIFDVASGKDVTDQYR